MDRSLTYRHHLESLKMKVASRVALIRKLAGTTWGADAATLRISVLALVFSNAEYCTPVWCRSSHTHMLDFELNRDMHIITGCLENTPTPMLYVLANVAPSSIRRNALVLKSAWKVLADLASLLHEVITVPARSYHQLQPPTRKSARLLPLPLPCQYAFPHKKLQWQGPSRSHPLPLILGIGYHDIFHSFISALPAFRKRLKHHLFSTAFLGISSPSTDITVCDIITSTNVKHTRCTLPPS